MARGIIKCKIVIKNLEKVNAFSEALESLCELIPEWNEFEQDKLIGQVNESLEGLLEFKQC
jgi:hypothetical protein